jgi:adenylate cyclase
MINPPTRDNLVQARRALARVVELDPDFAGGYAGLSTVYGYFVMHNFSDDPERDIQRAQELAEEALRRDARLSLPHIALGLSQLVKGDHQAAIAAARTATDVQPNDPEAHAFLGHFLLYAGNADAAIDALHVALELNPKHVQSVYTNLLAAAKWVAGRFDESAATFQRNVDGGGFCGRPAMVFWTAALQCAGRNAEAKEKAEELLSTMPSLTISTVPIIKLFARPEYRERLAQALRAAGIPNH